MLRKVNRIQKDADYKKIFKLSKPVYGEKIMIRSLPNRQSLKVRFGFIISNKIEKRATRRNSLKRKFRAVAAEFLPLVKESSDIVVIIKQNYSFPYSFELIRKDFQSTLQKTNVFNEKNHHQGDKALSKDAVS